MTSENSVKKTKKVKKSVDVYSEVPELVVKKSKKTSEEQTAVQAKATPTTDKKKKKRPLDDVPATTENLQSSTDSPERKKKKKKGSMKSVTGEESAYKPGALSSLFSSNDSSESHGKKDLFRKYAESESGFVPVEVTLSVPPASEGTSEKEADDKKIEGRDKQRENRKKKQTADERMTAEEKKRTVFVGNAPPSITRKQISKIFKECGAIESVRCRGAVGTKETLSKKVALLSGKINPNLKSVIFYIKYKEEESAKTALAKNGFEVEGHHLRVDSCIGRKDYDGQLTVFVGGLPFEASDDELFAWAEQNIGPVAFVRVVRQADSGYGKGFGFVSFKDLVSVKIALELKKPTFQERELRITKIMKKKDKKKLQNRQGGGKKLKKGNRGTFGGGEKHKNGGGGFKRRGKESGEGAEQRPELSKNVRKAIKKRKFHGKSKSMMH